MIDKKLSLSMDNILIDIDKYLESRNDYNDIKNSIPSSNLSFIKELIAGYSSYINYNYHRLRDETYLDSATQASSIYSIAHTFGYDIKRHSCPKITFRYYNVETIHLVPGQVLGKYNDYDLIYFDEPRSIEKLDTIDLCIGKVVNQKFSNIDITSKIIIDLVPQGLKSIDNEKVLLTINSEVVDITRNLEDYVTSNKVIDHSNDNVSTKILISEPQYKYGYEFSNKFSNLIDLTYIETDGYLDIKLNESQPYQNYNLVPTDIASYGNNGQSLGQIKRLAPLFFSTHRRMVTKADHKYIAETNSYLKSVGIDKDNGNHDIVTININNITSNVNSTIMINGSTHEFTSNSSDSTYTRLMEVLDTHEDIVVSENSLTQLVLKNKSTYKSLSIDYLSNAFSVEITEVGELPKCCTVNMHYVKYNTTNDPIALTSTEQLIVKKYLDHYKMVTTTIVLIPANKISRDLRVKYQVTDPKYNQYVRSEIMNIISSYELEVNKPFIYGQLLAKIGKISLIEGSELVNPVKHVEPDQVIFNLKPLVDSYYKFNTKLTLDNTDYTD
jgi:hypothetical protein